MNRLHTLLLRTTGLAVALLVLAAGVAQAQWSTEAPVPATGNYWGYASAYLDGAIYTFGGVSNNSSTIVNTSYKYNVGTNSWTNGPTLGTAFYLASAAAVQGKVYIVGGQTGNFATNTILNSLWIFDPSSGSLTQGPPMPKQTTAAAAVGIGSKLYVFGGIVVNGANLQTHQDVQIFDVNTNSWTTSTGTFPYGAYNLMATVDANGVVTVAGGQAANGAGFNNAYRGTVNNSILSFTPLANLPVVVAAGGMDHLNGKPFVAGGNSTQEGHTGAYVYNSGQNRWDAFFTIPSARSSVRMEGDGITPYLIGGSGTLQVIKAEEGEPAPVAVIGRTNFTLTLQAGESTTVNVVIANQGTQTLEASIDFDGTSFANDASTSVIAGGSGRLTIPVSASGLTEGRYQTSAELVTNDKTVTNVMVNIDLWVVDELVTMPNVAVLEESNGTWCPPCGTFGIPAVQATVAQYGDRVIVLSYHDKGGSRYDPLSITQGESLNNRLGLNAYPTGAVQRNLWDGSAYQIGASQFQQIVGQVLSASPTANAAIDVVEYDFNPTTRRVNAKVHVTSSMALNTSNGETINLTTIVKEDGFEYTQAFSDRPAAIVEHEHAVRHFYPDNDGAPINFPAEAKTEDGKVIKPNGASTVNVSFVLPESTTPTSSGPLSSVPITPENCKIVFLVTLNNGTALGPVLGAVEMELTEGVVAGPAMSVDWGVNVEKNINPTETAKFDYTVTNNTSEPLQVTIVRASEDLPSGWTSEICTGPNDCDDVDNLTFTIPADGKHVFSLKMYGATASKTGKVRLVVQAGTLGVDQTYTANTGVSSVAVPGEVNGFSMNGISPNPASSIARVDVTLPVSGMTTLEVFTSNGEKVGVLFEGRLEAGSRQIDADVSALSSGKYILVLSSGDTKVSRTITVVR